MWRWRVPAHLDGGGGQGDAVDLVRGAVGGYEYGGTLNQFPEKILLILTILHGPPEGRP